MSLKLKRLDRFSLASSFLGLSNSLVYEGFYSRGRQLSLQAFQYFVNLVMDKVILNKLSVLQLRL